MSLGALHIFYKRELMFVEGGWTAEFFLQKLILIK